MGRKHPSVQPPRRSPITRLHDAGIGFAGQPLPGREPSNPAAKPWWRGLINFFF